MRFIVLDVDAVAFQAAGFTQIPCPTITPEIVDGQKARCDKLRQLPKEFSDIIEDRFAMNIDAMCGATNAWYGLASPVTP